MKKKIFSTVLSAVLALSLCPAIALADTGDAETTDAEANIVEGVASEEATNDVSVDIQALVDDPVASLATDDIASGELGTCTWTIDSDGCLTIAPTNGVSGSFEVENPSIRSWPWYDSGFRICSVKVDPGVSASGSLAYMFDATGSGEGIYEYPYLTSIDLSNLDTSNVTSMAEMFGNCTSLTSINLSGLDTSRVSDMSWMFYNCRELVSLDVSGFNTSNVTKMNRMFDECRALTSLDVSNLDTSQVTDMTHMFEDCSALTSLDVSNLDTSNTTSLWGMFTGCSSLTSLDLLNFDTLNVTNMWGMFGNCSSLTSLDLSSFNTSNVTNMSGMFSGCSSLSFVDLSSFDTSSLSAFVSNYSMFWNCTNLRTVILGKNYSFSDVGFYLSTPVKDDVEGKWRSSIDGTIYDDPSQLPSNVAATYTAVFPTDKGGFAPIFSDVFTKIPANNWYYDAIYFMASIGIITGYDEDTFGVGQSMTRADLIVIIWRYCEPDAYEHYDQSTATNTSGLPDVPDKEYYTGAVNWAVANGVITGYDLGNGSHIFAPNDTVTFDQMVTIVARYALGFDAAESYNDSVLSNSRFTDGATVEDWARGSMAWAINNSVVTGNNNSNGTYTIAPLDNVARERGATVLARSIQEGLIIPN